MTPVSEARRISRPLRSTPLGPIEGPVVALVPHPDDEVLMMGGLLATLASDGVEVTVVAVTDGENAYPGAMSAGALGPARVREQDLALLELGIESSSVRRLRLPDSGVDVTSVWHGVVEHASSCRSVVAPWPGEPHRDHRAVGLAGARLARAARAQLIYGVFWAWHGVAGHVRSRLPWTRLELSPAAFDARRRALTRHQTQIDPGWTTPLLSDGDLEPMRWRQEFYVGGEWTPHT